MKLFVAAAVLAVTAGSAFAQGPAPAPTIQPPPNVAEASAPRPARARGISPALATEGALTAIATCLGNGYKVTGLITDTAGVPVALVSGEGAAAITPRVAMGKAQSALKYKMTSGEVAAKQAADKTFAAEIAADPQIVFARQGAVPIKVGDEVVGIFAVSGAPSGDKDEVCVRAGIAKIQDRIK